MYVCQPTRQTKDPGPSMPWICDGTRYPGESEYEEEGGRKEAKGEEATPTICALCLDREYGRVAFGLDPAC